MLDIVRDISVILELVSRGCPAASSLNVVVLFVLSDYVL